MKCRAISALTLLTTTLAFSAQAQTDARMPVAQNVEPVANDSATTGDSAITDEQATTSSGAIVEPGSESTSEPGETNPNAEELTEPHSDAATPVSPEPHSPETTSQPTPAPAIPTTASNPTATTFAHWSQIPNITAAPGQGITLSTGDSFSLNVRSRIQLRYQLNIPHEEEGLPRELEQLVGIGTARLWFSGNVFTPKLTYMIQLAVAERDFRDGAKSPVYDAYVDAKVHRDLGLRAGQFFVPFDRLRTVREWALQMADRPRPVAEFTLDRDVGLMLYSDRFLGEKSPFAYRVGVFGGGGPNLASGKEPGALIVGRLEYRPLGPIDDDREGDLERRRLPGLALGIAAAQNFNTDRLRSTTGPHFTEGTTDYFHAAADLIFKWRGFALQGEYLFKNASADEVGEEATRSGHGWVTQASYVFDPPVEIVGRLSRIYALPGTDPLLVTEAAERGQEVGVGVNYYINSHWLKLQADWIALMPPDFNFSLADQVVHFQLDVTF